MTERRSAYFVFQGLLTIILLLFFLYRREVIADWPMRLAILALLLGSLLVFLAAAPAVWLERPKVQGAWFVSDILLASLAMLWIHQPGSDLYLAYFLVIFGTALTQNMTQSFLVALVATVLYAYLSWNTTRQAPAEFWLRLPFLWIIASFTAMLSRDTRDAKRQQEENYRERLFHLERLATLGQIAAEVAHFVRAPLTTIRVNAEVLEHQNGFPQKWRGDLVQIQKEVDHCKEILQKLLDLGRIEEFEPKPMDLREAIRSGINTVEPQLRKLRIELMTEGVGEPASVRGDPVLLAEAISAVLQNAIEAMPEGGRLRVGLMRNKKRAWWAMKRNDQDYFDIVIEDDGIGIEPARLETIFRPFFTTKKGKGNGLGLSAALRILDKHGGSIKVHSEGRGRGARFTFTIPKSRP